MSSAYGGFGPSVAPAMPLAAPPGLPYNAPPVAAGASNPMLTSGYGNYHLFHHLAALKIKPSNPHYHLIVTNPALLHNPAFMQAAIQCGKLTRKHKGDDSSDSGGGTGKVSRDFKGVSQLHRRLLKKPSKLLRAFDKGVVDELGAHNTPWTYRDLNRAINWGKMRGLQRCHAVVGDILLALKMNQLGRGVVLSVQLLKALQQVVLDDGGWQVAMMLIPVPDPIYRKDFGGMEDEVQIISAHQKAVSDLKKNSRAVVDANKDAHNK